jgi:ataxin-3
MEYIFHEKQEGSLCAQHCLNSLLQGDYYSAVDLASIARDLDTIEQNFMTDGGSSGMNGGVASSQSKPESSNYDDTGFFSIQVLQNALKAWDLELVPYTSSQEVARVARDTPTEQRAYICNFREHWYTIRRIGLYWFNLNSLFTKPELVSDMHLSILLAQLINDGYSIFIVHGDLPKSEADFQLSNRSLNIKQILGEQSNRKKSNQPGSDEDLDDELKQALRMSLLENDMDLDRHGDPYPSLAYENLSAGPRNPVSSSHQETLLESVRSSLSRKQPSEMDDEDLRRAIELSMQESNSGSSKQTPSQPAASTATRVVSPPKAVDPEEVRRKRLEFLEKMQSQQSKPN